MQQGKEAKKVSLPCFFYSITAIAALQSEEDESNEKSDSA